MLSDWPGRIVFAVVLALFALNTVSIYTSMVEQRRWDAFSVAHECKVVGRMNSSSSKTPEKTGYACNDGVTYWR